MLLQVWVRGRRKNTRARSLASPRRAGPGSSFGRRARTRNVRVNGPPKSGSNPCGRAASFCRSGKEPIGSLRSRVKELIAVRSRANGYGCKERIIHLDWLFSHGRKSRSFPMNRLSGLGRRLYKADCSPAASSCHFESVTDFTRGFLGLVTD
jgi:hypothetical protein